MIKEILRPFVPEIVLNAIRKARNKRILEEWHKNGRPIPAPHLIKQMTIAEYQEKSKYGTMIETGTYLGNMVVAQKKRFKKIISIELGMDLYQRAKEKFRKDTHITILQGDSGKVLPVVMQEINEPAIFWLDGHYSAGITAKGDTECPIFEELDAIFKSKKLNHILLIDDARHFVGAGDYPTIDKVTEYIKSKNPKYQVEVKYDIIRYTI